MALTAEEETAVRALLSAVRKLPDASTKSRSVADQNTRAALDALENHIRAITNVLRKV